ncbi:hypothetical protein BSU01_02415 [Erwinia billingiae]|jgi:hypothetical protein|uniref:hypothetical protein n=1 Tax=Erwinia billingiae TaxID=182337 RepID=UPI0019D17C23|nr:hypothetical protein [Erwinia billingiae]MBN7120573.1 hypothetical protein [Erwinia billingiae]
MDKNDEEKRVDILLGEAVMVLLKEDAAISNAALIKQLRLQSEMETDPRQKRAYRLAVSEVRNYASAGTPLPRHQVHNRDKKRLLVNQGPPDGSKKH